jgi:hypothetical protein
MSGDARIGSLQVALGANPLSGRCPQGATSPTANVRLP